MNRKKCPCGNESTEFIQFGGADSSMTEVSPEEVGDALLEVRMCNECRQQVENLLTLERRII